MQVISPLVYYVLPWRGMTWVLTLDHLGDLEAEYVLSGVLDHLDDTGDDVVDDVEGGRSVNWERDAVAVEGVDGREVGEAL